jgi:parallel beta-helix repeat protein
MDDGRGIWLFDSSGNTIAENNITRNLSPGIWFSNSSNNVIFHNNFDFGFEDAIDTTSTNTFDDGYPNGGNYWGSGYSGPDNCCGPYQNLTGSDCIGDTQYSMNENNTDRYPFMEANGWLNHPVSIESNVTITHQVIGSGAMNFTASGPVGQIGYVNATMPIGFNSTDIRVFIDGLLVQQPLPIITTDGFHYFIYFEFSLSTHDITIQYAVPAATQTGGGGGRMPYMN